MVLRYKNCSMLTRTLAVHVLTRASRFSLTQEGATGEPTRETCMALDLSPSQMARMRPAAAEAISCDRSEFSLTLLEEK